MFDTAIIAGVMAAKRTHELIPFCHPIPLEDCKIAIEWGDGNEVVIECSVRATHKTGVEMEALTGAMMAALTIYDMCKALTHGIEIREVALLAKTGGKRDYAVSAERIRQDCDIHLANIMFVMPVGDATEQKGSEQHGGSQVMGFVMRIGSMAVPAEGIAQAKAGAVLCAS